ncbi:LexA family protein [Salinicoccus albus]|uniref:LexA family protein n=1 Tax=Salinicoccus albus TaxID=418756 RepID=UPI00036A61CC|nr:LexA family transcriptional regulator [Salinicoccus albus]
MDKLFQERLLQAIKESGLTKAEISKRSGISRGSITDYVKGRYEAKQDKVYQLAQVLGVKSEWLMGYNVSKNNSTQPVTPIQVKPVPVVSQISAGKPVYGEENIIEYTYVPENLFKLANDLFGLKISGDSMDKEFKEGDIVIVEKDGVVEDGQIGVVMLNGYDATVKRIRYGDDKILLYPESSNPDHLPQIYNGDDEVQIIGRVVSSQKFY